VPKSLDEIRRELARLARRKDCRVYIWTKERPTDWNPGQVLNPETGIPFSAEAAWQFVADRLNAGQELVEVEMKKPPNEMGYVMQIDLSPGTPKLYVKLQINRGRIFGRSFHYSLQAPGEERKDTDA
jgi:hypothetical protein